MLRTGHLILSQLWRFWVLEVARLESMYIKSRGIELEKNLILSSLITLALKRPIRS